MNTTKKNSSKENQCTFKEVVEYTSFFCYNCYGDNMSKFRKMPDRLGVIDQNVAESKDPVAYLDGRIRATRADLVNIRQQKGQTDINHRAWYERQEQFMNEQITLLEAKREDVAYGTHNFDIMRTTEELDSVKKELDYAGLLESIALRPISKKLKNKIAKFKAQDREIRRTLPRTANGNVVASYRVQQRGR